MVLFSFSDDTKDGVRQRKNGNKNDNKEGKATDKTLVFEINKLECVTSDFGSGGGFQKCVRFSLDGKLLATAGADGYVRVWKVNFYPLFYGKCFCFVCMYLFLFVMYVSKLMLFHYYQQFIFI